MSQKRPRRTPPTGEGNSPREGVTKSPWERRRDESTPAFEAFATYRDMGPDRSTAKVAHALSKSKTLADRWSGRHAWVERAAGWDAAQDALARERSQREVQLMRERHTRDAMAAQDAVMLPIRKLLERYEKGDLEVVGAFDSMPPKDLVELALAASRAHRYPVAVEMLARGVGKTDGEASDEDEDAIRELASALEAVAKDRRGAARKKA